jgi:hypothetical protein
MKGNLQTYPNINKISSGWINISENTLMHRSRPVKLRKLHTELHDLPLGFVSQVLKYSEKYSILGILGRLNEPQT